MANAPKDVLEELEAEAKQDVKPQPGKKPIKAKPISKKLPLPQSLPTSPLFDRDRKKKAAPAIAQLSLRSPDQTALDALNEQSKAPRMIHRESKIESVDSDVPDESEASHIMRGDYGKRVHELEELVKNLAKDMAILNGRFDDQTTELNKMNELIIKLTNQIDPSRRATLIPSSSESYKALATFGIGTDIRGKRSGTNTPSESVSPLAKAGGQTRFVSFS
jgi:hypothetical protein